MLKKIKALKISVSEDGKERHFIKAPTKLQKDIFDNFDIELKP